MKKFDKIFIMTIGTVGLGFATTSAMSLWTGDAMTPKSNKMLIAFAIASIVGGIFTAQVIKRIELQPKSE